MEQMFQKHLDLTTGEVVGQLKKDWAADIRSCDECRRLSRQCRPKQI